MSVREYIGARYVPLFIGVWDITNSYEPLSIVTYQGNSYTSRQSVPPDISLENEEYWALTGNYNAQVEQYRQEVVALSNEVADIETYVNNKFPAIEGEIGVVNSNYYWGDCRRYGVFPNTENAISATLIQNCIDNSTNLQMEIFFPAGLYNSQLNINQSNVWLRMAEGAEWKGIIHIVAPNNPADGTYIENVNIAGTITGYARFGMTNAHDIYVENIHMKDDNSSSRGVHLYYNTKNFRCNSIVIDDAKNSSMLLDAALSIDGYFDNPIGSGVPENFFINNVIIKDSRVHGAYITGKNINIENILVENWGYGSYNGNGLQGANGLAQSSILHGVWINRARNCHIGNIVVKMENQSLARTNTGTPVYLDETGWGSTIKSQCDIDSICVYDFAFDDKKNNAVQIGDNDYTSPCANYNIGTVEVNVSEEAMAIIGYWACIACLDSANVEFGYVFIPSANKRCGMYFGQCSNTIKIEKYVCLNEQQNAIRVSSCTNQIIFENVYVERVGDSHASGENSGADSIIYSYNSQIILKNVKLKSNNAVSSPAITFDQCKNCVLDTASISEIKSVAIWVRQCNTITIKNARLNGSNAGNGIKISGSYNYNVLLDTINVQNFDIGINDVASANSRFTAINSVCVSNTTNTNLAKPSICGDVGNYAVFVE